MTISQTNHDSLVQKLTEKCFNKNGSILVIYFGCKQL
jgi:hypothetical protein